jgi:hypothetical protein
LLHSFAQVLLSSTVERYMLKRTTVTRAICDVPQERRSQDSCASLYYPRGFYSERVSSSSSWQLLSRNATAASVRLLLVLMCLARCDVRAGAVEPASAMAPAAPAHVVWPTDDRNMTVCPLTHVCVDPSSAADGCRVCLNAKHIEVEDTTPMSKWSAGDRLSEAAVPVEGAAAQVPRGDDRTAPGYENGCAPVPEWRPAEFRRPMRFDARTCAGCSCVSIAPPPPSPTRQTLVVLGLTKSVWDITSGTYVWLHRLTCANGFTVVSGLEDQWEVCGRNGLIASPTVFGLLLNDARGAQACSIS